MHLLGEIWPPGLMPWAAVVLAAVVLAAAWADLKYNRVPNWVTYPAILMGLAGHAAAGGIQGGAADFGLTGAAAGFAVGFFPLLLCWLAGGIGGGDAKLMGAIGALGGWRLALAAMMYGFILAAVMALIVMVRQRVVRRTLGRIWTAMRLLLTPGARAADPSSADSPKIPFAVALCLGTLLALAASGLPQLAI